jgi:hypothetical protein
MPITTIRVVSGADALKTEGLVFESVHMGYMRMACQVELPILSICMVWAKGSKTMHIIGPRSHKATKVEGFRGKMQKDIKWVSRNNIGKLRYNYGGRWGCIPGFGGGIGIGRSGRKSRGRIRT